MPCSTKHRLKCERGMFLKKKNVYKKKIKYIHSILVKSIRTPAHYTHSKNTKIFKGACLTQYLQKLIKVYCDVIHRNIDVTSDITLHPHTALTEMSISREEEMEREHERESHQAPKPKRWQSFKCSLSCQILSVCTHTHSHYSSLNTSNYRCTNSHTVTHYDVCFTPHPGLMKASRRRSMQEAVSHPDSTLNPDRSICQLTEYHQCSTKWTSIRLMMHH